MENEKFLIDESEVHYESLRMAFTAYDLSYVADWTLVERAYEYIRSRERQAYTELSNVVDAKVENQITYYKDLSEANFDACMQLAEGDLDSINWVLDIKNKMDSYYGKD